MARAVDLAGPTALCPSPQDIDLPVKSPGNPETVGWRAGLVWGKCALPVSPIRRRSGAADA